MGFFLGILKLLFGKREPWTPLFMLSDCEDDEGPQLRFDCEGDYTGECCEILDRLCAGRFVATWMEDLFWMEQRQEKRTREIVYRTTFPMYYAQEIAGTDDLLRMHGDWKELISVSRGFDRKLFAAFLETSYVHCCDDRLYVFDETPPGCRTPPRREESREGARASGGAPVSRHTPPLIFCVFRIIVRISHDTDIAAQGGIAVRERAAEKPGRAQSEVGERTGTFFVGGVPGQEGTHHAPEITLAEQRGGRGQHTTEHQGKDELRERQGAEREVEIPVLTEFHGKVVFAQIIEDVAEKIINFSHRSY